MTSPRYEERRLLKRRSTACNDRPARQDLMSSTMTAAASASCSSSPPPSRSTDSRINRHYISYARKHLLSHKEGQQKNVTCRHMRSESFSCGYAPATRDRETCVALQEEEETEKERADILQPTLRLRSPCADLELVCPRA